MGKVTGFLEIERHDLGYDKPEVRRRTWTEFLSTAMRLKNGVESITSPAGIDRVGSRPKPPKAVAQRASLEASRCMPDHQKAKRRLTRNTVAFPRSLHSGCRSRRRSGSLPSLLPPGTAQTARDVPF